MKKTAIFLFSYLLLVGCNSVINKKGSDLESLQLKSSFVDLEENNLDLSEFDNKKVVISYWATWCAPCIKEMPSIKRAEEILEDYGYTFLLVSDETNPLNLLEYMLCLLHIFLTKMEKLLKLLLE